MAVRFGERRAAVVAVAFFVFVVALTLVTWVLGLVGPWFIPMVLVTDVGFLACTALLLLDHSRDKARQIKKVILYLFLVGLLAYIFGVIK